MGPLTLVDFIGLDTVVRIADIMFDAYRNRYAPPPLLGWWWPDSQPRPGSYDY